MFVFVSECNQTDEMTQRSSSETDSKLLSGSSRGLQTDRLEIMGRRDGRNDNKRLSASPPPVTDQPGRHDLQPVCEKTELPAGRSAEGMFACGVTPLCRPQSPTAPPTSHSLQEAVPALSSCSSP